MRYGILEPIWTTTYRRKYVFHPIGRKDFFTAGGVGPLQASK